MDSELRNKLNNANKAENKGVYEFTNASGDYKGLCIVVSGNHRRFDKYVSIVSLSSCEYDDGMHNDEVKLCLPDGKEFLVHCGMITYIRRDRLGEMICKVSNNTMKIIGEKIKQELGLSEKTDKIIVNEDTDYEKLYKDLIKTLASWGKNI